MRQVLTVVRLSELLSHLDKVEQRRMMLVWGAMHGGRVKAGPGDVFPQSLSRSVISRNLSQIIMLERHASDEGPQ